MIKLKFKRAGSGSPFGLGFLVRVREGYGFGRHDPCLTFVRLLLDTGAVTSCNS